MVPYKDKIQSYIRSFLRSVQLDTDRSFLLEVNSDGELKICGIKDIQGYDEKNVLVLSDRFLTEVKGENLMLRIFSDKQISLTGDVETINFIRR